MDDQTDLYPYASHVYHESGIVSLYIPMGIFGLSVSIISLHLTLNLNLSLSDVPSLSVDYLNCLIANFDNG